MSAEQQPVDARSLDLGLRHLGYEVRVTHATRCAVCGERLDPGPAIECAATNSLSHRACGELLKPGGES